MEESLISDDSSDDEDFEGSNHGNIENSEDDVEKEVCRVSSSFSFPILPID
jgi:hypothetical protein